MYIEFNFLTDIVKRIFSFSDKKTVVPDKLNIKVLVELSKKNNLLYSVLDYINSDAKLKMILGKDELELLNQLETKYNAMAISVKELYKNVNFNPILIKTYRKHKRIPNDIDFIVTELNSSLVQMNELYEPLEEYDEIWKQQGFLDKHNTKLHYHGEVGWLNRFYLDKELILQDPIKVNMYDVEVSIANYNADYLIHLAHMNFEPMHFIYSELAYLYSIRKHIDISICQAQAKKHNWLDTFNRTEAILDIFYKKYFESDYISKEEIDKYIMPHTFSRFQTINAFLRKLIIIEPIMKINKVINVLLTNNSYDKYYEAPEDRLKVTQSKI